MSAAVTKAAPTSVVPEPFARRGVEEAAWRTLANNLYPGAAQDSVLMVVDYCRARGLDPMKKPCHIVPMRVKQGGEYVTRDVVMPGIYEYRTTAHRTGQYLGRTSFTYGERITYKGQAKDPKYAGVSAPEWAECTFRRRTLTGDVAEFTVRRYFAEVVGTEWKTGEVNDRWTKAPTQMLEKCVEAAGLREAFPEDIGGEPTMDEIDGQTVAHEPTAPTIQQPQRKAETAAVVAETPAKPATTAPAAAPVETGAAVVEAEVVEHEQIAADPDAVRIVDAVENVSKKTGVAFWVAKDSRDRTFLTTDAQLGAQLLALKGASTAVVLTLEAVEGQKVPSVTELQVQR